MRSGSHEVGFGARVALLFCVSTAAAGALLASGPRAARADVIYQPGGGKIVGEIVEEKEDYVGIRTRAGGVMRIPRDEIDRIERGPVPASPAPAPAAPAPPAPPSSPGGVGAPKLPASPQRPPVAPPPASGGASAGAGGSGGTGGAAAGTTVPAGSGDAEGTGAGAGTGTGSSAGVIPRPPPPPGGASPLQPGKLGGGKLGAPGTGESSVCGIDEEALYRPRLKAVQDWFEKHGAKLKQAIPQLLKDRRKAALDFIMDPRKYPEENHGAVAQPEVDRLVALLRRVWEDPFSEAYELSEELRRLVEDLEEVGDSDPIRAKVNKALAPVNEPPPERDLPAIEWNAKAKSEADDEERACVVATNRYRMMYGLKVLRMDDRLLRAGRKHSKAMLELGFFDHGSPVKGSETPDKRCASEGASYSGENIAMGSGSGVDAFRQWYNSSGHHRNILGDHVSIGVGRHESYWTQDFGKDVPK